MIANSLTAEPFYWVGGSGEWDDVGHWATTSGGNTFYGVLPSANDDVFIDANSFDGPDQGIDLRDLNAQCRSLTVTTDRPGAYLRSTGGSRTNGQLEIYGSVTLSGSIEMEYTPNLIFRGSADNTLAFGGRPLYADLVFSGAAGGTWLIESPINTTRRFIAMTGEISFAPGLTLQCEIIETNRTALMDFTGLRRLVTQSIEMDLEAINATQLANCSVVFTPGRRPEFIVTGLSDLSIQSLTFRPNDAALELKGGFGRGADFPLLSADSIIFLGDTEVEPDLRVGYLYLAPGTSHDWTDVDGITVTDELVASGDCAGRIELRGGASTTVTAAASVGIEVSAAIIDNVRATGGANFVASASIGNGDTNGWDFTGTVASARYWVGGTGDWTDDTHWAYTSGGTPGACPPSAFDDAYFDGNSFTANGQRVSLPVGRHAARTMDWRGIDREVTLEQAEDAELELHGSMYLSPRMTWENDGRLPLTFAGGGAGKEILSVGRTEALRLQFSGPGSEWTLLDDLVTGATMGFNDGTLNTGGNDLRATAFDMLNKNFILLGSGSTFFVSASTRGGRWRLKPGRTSYYDLSGARLINENTDTPFEFGMVNNNGRPNEIELVRSLGPLLVEDFTETEDIDAGTIDLRQGATLEMNGRVGELILAGGYSYNFENGSGDELAIGTLTSNSSCLEQTTIQAENGITFSSTATQAVEWVQLRNVSATGPGWTATSSIDLGGNPGWSFQRHARLAHPVLGRWRW